jgi:hypothetical protein
MSGAGLGVVLGPGTAGVVESPGRTGAGVMVSGFVAGLGAPGWSRLHAESDSTEMAAKIIKLKCFMRYSSVCCGAGKFCHTAANSYVSRIRTKM